MMSYWQDKVIIMLDRHGALLAASFKLLSKKLLTNWMRIHALGIFKGHISRTSDAMLLKANLEI